MREEILSIVDIGDGFEVETTDQVISLRILGSRSCCEHFGYFLSQDNLRDFEGADLISVRVVDAALETVEVPDVYEGGVMFVNLETSEGLLQFVAYNSHNGYYGHQALVESKQLTHGEYL